jgi:YidC/Oxa1 family membrane protein insertase
LIFANSITHSVGQIFQPIFKLFALILAFIYSFVPNYALAIALLTILIMGVLTPLTVKSTKSMIAMQRLQPEIKKLQQKYKGAENRAQLNEEMMRLYKEEGVSPAGGCLPMFLQFPFLIILYDIIRGLTNISSTKLAVPAACHLPIRFTNVAPRYIPNTSKMYCNLIGSGGKMMSFGINLALKPFSHHSSWLAAVPYFALVALAVGLQYLQMNQMNKRNPATQANKQMATLQKFMPILFAYIYFLIPAAVLIYMIVSTLIRIGTQDIIFRTGVVTPLTAGQTSLPKASSVADDKPSPAPAGSKGKQTAPNASKDPETPKPQPNPTTRSKNKRKRKDR